MLMTVGIRIFHYNIVSIRLTHIELGAMVV
jgi:hypothetical protein